jgi:hypothetical protein
LPLFSGEPGGLSRRADVDAFAAARAAIMASTRPCSADSKLAVMAVS